MKRKKHILSILCAAAMLLLIIDTTTATEGAAEGLDICIKVIIPSLFPFFIVSTYLNSAVLGLRIPGLDSLGRILHIPSGGESLLFLGLIGGYPVGAQLIADTYRQGSLDKETSQILLGYCNNAGPAFIFGIAGALFSSRWGPICLWAVHLVSAVLTGLLLPRPKRTTLSLENTAGTSLVTALRKSIFICASVCAWVITFKIILAYLSRWIFCTCEESTVIFISGILELSNGCIKLARIPSEAHRFLLCAVFLAFGGLCVTLQTMSAVGSLGLGLYLPGKLIQTSISLAAALFLSFLLFPGNELSVTVVILLLSVSALIILGTVLFTKKRCGNPQKNHV